MAFLKRHGFYIALILVVTSISGSLWGMFIRPRGQRSGVEVDRRVKAYKQIEDLSRNGKNSKQVTAEKNYVEEVRAEYAKMVKAVAQMNQRDRDSLIITLETGETFPVFPVDRVKYRANAVQLRFRQVYVDAMDALFDQLSATTPPTMAEINAAVQQMRNYLNEKARDDDDKAMTVLPVGVMGTADPKAAGGFAVPMGGMGGYGGGMGGYGGGIGDMGGGIGGMGGGIGGYGGGIGGYGGGMGGYGGGMGGGAPKAGGGAAGVDSAEASSQALGNLQILRTTDPEMQVYAVKSDSFHYHPLTPLVDAPIAEMWKATVNYWMHRYLIDTIQRTNAEHAQRKGTPATIASNIVKRLVSVQIGTVSGSVAAGKTAMLYEGETEPAATMATGGDAGMGGMGSMGMGGVGGMGIGMGMPGGGVGQQEAQGRLTERVCTPQYDVVNLQVTVVVAGSQLQGFLTNLVNDGFYTIQQVDLYDAEIDTTQGRPGMASARATVSNTVFSEQEYYYGSDPVVKAVIHVEALLFTNWERYLMPIEMLQRLPAEALRPADQERLMQAETAAQAAAAGGPMGGS